MINEKIAGAVLAAATLFGSASFAATANAVQTNAELFQNDPDCTEITSYTGETDTLTYEIRHLECPNNESDWAVVTDFKGSDDGVMNVPATLPDKNTSKEYTVKRIGTDGELAHKDDVKKLVLNYDKSQLKSYAYYIASRAFANAKQLEEADIAASVIVLDSAFENIKSLKTVQANPAIDGFNKDECTSLFYVGKNGFRNCSELSGTIKLGSRFGLMIETAIINENAFNGCSKAEEFKFPYDSKYGGSTTVYDYAFSGTTAKGSINATSLNLSDHALDNSNIKVS